MQAGVSAASGRGPRSSLEVDRPFRKPHARRMTTQMPKNPYFRPFFPICRDNRPGAARPFDHPLAELLNAVWRLGINRSESK